MDLQEAGPSHMDMAQNVLGELYSSRDPACLSLDLTESSKHEGNGEADLGLLCRICASTNENFIPIFEGEGIDNNLAEKILNHLPIKVDVRDTMPDQVCFQCASTLLAWHDLVQCCIQADAALHARVARGHTRNVKKRHHAGNGTSTKERSAHFGLSCNPPPTQSAGEGAPANPAISGALAGHRPQACDYSRSTRKDASIVNPQSDETLGNYSSEDKEQMKEVHKSGPKHIENEIETDPHFYKNFNKKEKSTVLKQLSIVKNLPDNFFEDLHTALVNFKSHFETFHRGNSTALIKPLEENEDGSSTCSYKDEDNDYSDFPIQDLNYQTDNDDKSDDPNAKRRKATIFDKENADVLDKARVVVNGCVSYRCLVCGRNLSSAHTFIFHMRIHSGEKPCVCHLCGKQFRITTGLQRHLKETHQRIKNHSCETCDRKFTNRQNLVQHRRIHTGECPFVCSECGKRFKQRGSLYIHSKTHTDNYPFACSTCEAKFRSRAQLTHHIYKHTGEKPNVCDVCGRAFRVKHELNTHKLIHTDDKPFTCSECGVSFRQRRYLRNHYKKTHNSHQLVLSLLKKNKSNEYIKKFSSSSRRYDIKDENGKHESSKKYSSHANNSIHNEVQVKTETYDISNDNDHFDDFGDDNLNDVSDDSEDDIKPLKDLQMARSKSSPQTKDENKELKTWKCDKCSESFDSTTALDSHKEKFHQVKKSNHSASNKKLDPNRTYTCNFCGFTFKREDQLISHVTLSHDEHLGPKKRGRPSKKDILAKNLRLKGLLESMNIKTEFDDSNEITTAENPELGDDMAACPVVQIEVALGMEIFQQPDYCGKPAICKLCNKAFTRTNFLKQHFREHSTMENLATIDFKQKEGLLTDHTKVVNTHSENITDDFLNTIIAEDLRSGNVERYIGEIKVDTDDLVMHDSDLGDLPFVSSRIKKEQTSLSKPKRTLSPKSRKNKLHKCSLCDQSFSRTNHIIRHMSVHSYNYPYKCETCNKVFPNNEILSKHKRMQCENLTKPYQCGTCDMKFTYEMSLNKHILRYHKGESVSVNFIDPLYQKKEKNFSCSSCSKSFFRQEHLNKHAKVHMPHEKKFECPICQKKFNRKDNLRSHTRIHEPNKEEIESNCLCVYCGRSFSNSSNLIVHMRRHTGEKPYKCDICGKGFPRSSDLQCHRRTHTGEKPCLCTICGKGFSRSNKLVRHMRIHTGQRPYKCTFCDRAFTQSNDLTLHIRRHTGDKPYVCGICGDRFIQGTALQSHRRMQGHYEVENQPTPFSANSVNNPSREHGANRVARVGITPKNEVHSGDFKITY